LLEANYFVLFIMRQTISSWISAVSCWRETCWSKCNNNNVFQCSLLLVP